MSEYTVEDFANARFAARGDRAAVRRRFGVGRVWSEDGATWSDQQMADDGGWVPAPIKPTMTVGLYEDATRNLNAGDRAIFSYALHMAGVEIVPDPEPTNVEKLHALISENRGWVGNLAEHLDEAGVKAPEDK